MYDIYLLIKLYFMSKYICEKRRNYQYDDVSMHEYLKHSSWRLKVIIRSLLSSIGGLDGNNTSLAVVLRLVDTDAHFLDYKRIMHSKNNNCQNGLILILTTKQQPLQQAKI